MDSKRIALLTVAICAIGIFALPGTVSLFSGQHSWYGLDSPGNDVPCEKCHGDIADEMGNTGPHADMECWYCHKTGDLVGFSYASGDGTGSTPGQGAHAASLVECMACHEGFGGYEAGCSLSICHFGNPPHPPEWNDTSSCKDCHKGDLAGSHPVQPAKLEAGGFNLTVNSSDTGERAAHMDFVNDSIDDDLMEGANEACIACHTQIGVNISWTKSTTLHFNANETHDGTWIIDDFTAHGQNETFSTYKNNWTNSY